MACCKPLLQSLQVSVSQLGVHGDLLKGSTRPVKEVHDRLLAGLSSTEIQKYHGTVTQYF